MARGLCLLLTLSLVWPQRLALGAEAAAGKPSLAFIGLYPYNGDLELQAVKRITEQLAQQPVLQVADPAKVQEVLKMEAQGRSESQLAFNNELENDIKEAKRLYDNLRFEESLNVLKQAQVRLEGNFARLRSQKLLLQLHLYRGMNLIALGEMARAQGAFEDMLRYDNSRQSRQLNPRNFPPRILKVFDNAKNAILRKDKASLNLRGSPAGAVVYLDGAALGPLPQRIGDLPLGDHYLTVTADSFETYANRLFVDVGRNELKVELKKLPLFAVEGAVPAAASREALKRVAGRSGAEVLLLAELSRPEGGWGISGLIYDNRTDERGEVRRFKAESEGALLDGLAGWLQQLLAERGLTAAAAVPEKPLDTRLPALENPPLVQLPPPEPEAQPAEGQRPFYNKTWFWLVVAGVAAGATAGTLIATGAIGGKSGAPVLVIRTPP